MGREVRNVRRIDVSMPLFAGMPAFPGDPVFESQPSHAIARGDAYNVSRVAFGTHAGTHVDPPLHFLEGAPGTDRLDLNVLNGPCRVIDVDPTHRAVTEADVARLPAGTVRALFRTANSARWARELVFFGDYVALTPGAADALLARRVGVVGIDALSIEADATGAFPVHHRLLGGGCLILEGLLLAETPPGEYDLACLPLRLRGGDGGPARVVLTVP